MELIHESIRKQVGERIRDERESQNMTQKVLSLRSGIEQSQLSRMELGHRKIAAEELVVLALALNTTSDTFLKGLADLAFLPGGKPADRSGGPALPI